MQLYTNHNGVMTHIYWRYKYKTNYVQIQQQTKHEFKCIVTTCCISNAKRNNFNSVFVHISVFVGHKKIHFCHSRNCPQN